MTIKNILSIIFHHQLFFQIRDAQTAEGDRRICSQVLRQLQHRVNRRGDSTESTSLVPTGPATGGGARTANFEEAGVIQAMPERRAAAGQGSYWETSITPSVIPGG